MSELDTAVPKIAVPASSRFWAFLAYLLGPIGWGVAVLFGRKDPFVRFHVRQSIGIWAGVIIGVITWFIIGGVILIIPYFGPMLSAASFALVIALVFTCFVFWIRGMLNAIKGKMRVVPIFGERAERWLGGERRKPKSQIGSFEQAAYANLAETSQGQ